MISDRTVQRTVVVTDPVGVHLRTALAIVEIVKQGRSRVYLWKDPSQRVECNEVIPILGVVAECGTQLYLEATGPDAEGVLDALSPVFAGFEEDAKAPQAVRSHRRKRKDEGGMSSAEG
jgi:phosphotransferase system HPr (HPr) family protein